MLLYNVGSGRVSAMQSILQCTDLRSMGDDMEVGGSWKKMFVQGER